MSQRRRLGGLAGVSLVAVGLVLSGTGAAPVVAAEEVAPAVEGAEAAPPSVGWVGDSVAFQSLYTIAGLLRADREVTFSWSDLGIEIRDALPAVRRQLSGQGRPDIFVVVMGTAQSHEDPPDRWRRELTQLLDLASPRVDCIRVFDIDDTRTGFYRHHDRNARAFNAITHSVVSRYPNAEWYHFEAWAELAGPEYERRDILHHRPAGRAAIARQIRDAARSCDPGHTTGPFWDVRDSTPGALAIAWVHDEGLFGGYPNGTYRATIDRFTINASRGAMVKMAWRLAGRPRGFGPHPWPDVGSALDPPVRWAHAKGLIGGYDGRFRPQRPVRRIDAVRLLWVLAGRPEIAETTPWSDTDSAAARWAAATGVLRGYADGTFRPRAPLSRADLAQLLYRYAHLPPPASATPAPPTTGPPTTVEGGSS